MTDVRLRVLIADDDASVRRLIEVCVEREGHVTLSASDGQEAVDLFRRERPDFAILDLWMPRLDGLQAMSAIHQEAPRLPVLIITGDATIPRVIEAVRQGAYDFVAKPLDLNHLSLTIRQTAEHVLLQRRVTTLAEQLNEIYGFGEVAANSAGMKRAVRLLRQAATSNATVLLLGESGTGKGLLAHELHRMGPRAHGPFVAVNCAAIPEQLLESELFGHEKGAFTGADARRIGKFEAAQGGAVFLDEIGEMAPGMQAKLLRVLQEREVVRVGSNTPLPLDVRV
ncbi:MAG: sigma-54-dependent Fis family transcriptional regulator, partial [Planctomycetes bacterium]|nr:sigma-54-dependent Fis family transcriptional regulator [Planctomycetota bacterium]